MTEQTARRVANEICLVQLKATAMLVADGIAPERLEWFPSNYGGHEHNLCGIAVDGHWAAHVRWEEHEETVEIELTWADAWCHLRGRA